MTHFSDMSYLPSIRPSMLPKKWIKSEIKINKIEIVKKKEERLKNRYKLITKQSKRKEYGLRPTEIKQIISI